MTAQCLQIQMVGGHRPPLQTTFGFRHKSIYATGISRRTAMKNLEAVAGNGLLHRRAFLRGGAALAGAMTGYTVVQSASAQQLADDPWSLTPGAAVPDYGTRSKFEKDVVRTLSNPKAEPRTQHARTPH